jgi:predicted ATPase
VQNELELHRQCKVMPLPYMSESEAGEYLRARFPAMDSAASLAPALHQRTNGNPLYVVSLVDELTRCGKIGAGAAAIRGVVPDTLQQMFERQAAHLTGPEQEMLEAAAVAGESFSIAAVAAALGWEGARAESLCEALVRRHMILKRGALVRFPDGLESPGYSFLHGLCRDALYRKTPAGCRSRLHGALGQAEEQLFASDPRRIAAELAGHFELAGDFSRAVQYLRMAASGAAERSSNQEAERYLDRAWLIKRLRDADQAPRQRVTDEPPLSGAADRATRALLESVVPSMIVNSWQSVTTN